MTQPTLNNYLEASSFAYNSGTMAGAPAGFSGTFEVKTPHYASSNNYDAFNPLTGFYAAAYTLGTGANESIVISFEGTNIANYQANSVFSTAEILADYKLYKGELPADLKEAATFAENVLKTAQSEGISKSNIYLTGHSLGGAEAEYADVKTGLTGTTFGAPGISSDYIPSGKTSHLTDYVEYGDPVGNYAYTGPNSPEGPFIYSDNVEHFGTTKYTGHPSDALALIASGQAYGSSNSEVKAGGLTGFLLAADNFHPLTVYAGSLEHLLADPPSGATSISGPNISNLISGILAKQT